MAGVLAGVRILDLTRAYAGPIGTRMLADMGAEVIKVEAVQMIDMPSRRLAYAENALDDEPWNRSGVFHWLNNNKRGITLNLSDAKGIELVRELVKISDVVAENHSPRVMKNLDLDYDSLRQLNPSVILVSMSGFGQTGPHRDFVAYASVMEAAGGLTAMNGYTGDTPRNSGTAYGDWVLGAHGAASVVLALFRRQRTGQGAYIDVAGREAVTSHIGEAVLDFSMNRRVAKPAGNSDGTTTPHDCFRCKDGWIAIAVTNDCDWQRLCDTISQPANPRFATETGRWQHRDEVRRLVETWTFQRTAHDAFGVLQRAGIPAGPVLDARDVMLDPHMTERRFFEPINHPAVGRRLHNRHMPARFSGQATEPMRPAPRVGEHNADILHFLLGLDARGFARLEKERIIGNAPDKLPRSATELPLNQPLWEREGLIRLDHDYNERLSKAYGERLGAMSK
ncbi:MAG: CoA transferase [Chloroflexi bacterium]|nr:CoA transferase [Chloroflexota bacterium]